VLDPVLARLQVDHVALFQVDDLVGHAGQGHGVRGQKALGLVRAAHAQHQGRALPGADHALGLVSAEHGNGVGARQAQGGSLHGGEQVTLVQVLHQVGDHLGVGLAQELVALGLQFSAQGLVVLDDAVVHQGHAAGAGGRGPHTGAMREMRVSVVHRRRPMCGPAGVGDAQRAVQPIGGHLRLQFGHARGAAGTQDLALAQDGHTTGIVAPVLQALEAFDQDGGDVARTDRADDAAHGHWLLLPRHAASGTDPILLRLNLFNRSKDQYDKKLPSIQRLVNFNQNINPNGIINQPFGHE